MGSSKRYAYAIDRRVEQRLADAAARPIASPPVVKDWRPPWPPIRIRKDEWVIMRDNNREPAALVRSLQLGPRNETFFRVVTWAVESHDRALVGYFRTLDEADRSVLFSPDNPQVPTPGRT
ncbi:hypothetical protein IWX81_002858 [Salinibacterium sp. CAN_S4]